MSRKDQDINDALDFLRDSMKNEEEDIKVRQISAKTILSYYRDVADSKGKKGEAEDRAALDRFDRRLADDASGFDELDRP